MFSRIAVILGWLRRFGASRSCLLIENFALRQQLAVLTAKRPRPRMRVADRVFWLGLRRFWPQWKEALVIIQPDTVVRWHREGFRKYWTWKSRRRSVGHPFTKAEIRALVRRMAAENLTWGAPRIHGEVLAAMDFLTVPTATFRVLYVFFVIHHARRTVLHVHVAEHPTGTWIIQQLREAFPFDSAPRYLIFENDKKYGADVLAVIEHMGIRHKQITPHSPWQKDHASHCTSVARFGWTLGKRLRPESLRPWLLAGGFSQGCS